MPSSLEILHNRTFQQPSKPSTPFDMEMVQNFLLSRKQSQKTHFDWSHGARELEELSPGQEVLFRSPADDKYKPGTTVDKATKPHSYIMEAQGKHYQWTREHMRPIHLYIPFSKSQTNNPLNPKPFPCTQLHPKKPNPNLKSVYQPKRYLPQPSFCLPSHIPKPVHLPKFSQPSADAPPILSNYYNICPSSAALPLSLVLILHSLSYPLVLNQCLLHLRHWRRSVWRALTVHHSHPWCPVNPAATLPHSTCSATSTVSTWVLRPRLPITYNEAALSQLHGRPQVRRLHNVSIPFPLVTRSHHPALTLMSRSHLLQKLRLIIPPAQRSYISKQTRWWTPPQTKGGVINKATARLSPQTRGGVTSASSARLPSGGVTNGPYAKDPPDQPHEQAVTKDEKTKWNQDWAPFNWKTFKLKWTFKYRWNFIIGHVADTLKWLLFSLNRVNLHKRNSYYNIYNNLLHNLIISIPFHM